MIGPGGEVVKQELEVGEVVEQQVVTMDGSIVQQGGSQNLIPMGTSDEDKQAVEYIVTLEQAAAAAAAGATEPGEVVVVQGQAVVDGRPVGMEGMQDMELVDPEEMLKAYYTTHSNTLGDSWFICKKCPTFKTSHNSTLRDHINVEHMKIPLRCTHCDFETLRFKTLNSHRKSHHGLGAFVCYMDKCNFKTILTPRMTDHLVKKHELSVDDAINAVNTLIASQPATSGVAKPRRRNEHLGGIGEGSPVKEFKPRAQRKTDEERQYRIHYNEDGRVGCYQCLYCEFTTKMSQNISGHVNAKHLGKQIKCEECSFSTYYPKNLAVHYKKLHHKTGRVCAVPGCKFKAIQDERMNNHLIEKHGGRYDDEKNTIFVDLNNC